MKRKIAFFTGSRADYGLMKPLMERVIGDKNIIFSLIVTGSHLEKRFGNTWKQIQKDGFKISSKFKILSDDDSPTGISQSLSRAVRKTSEVLHSLNPDLLVILGDRYEALAAAQAAMIHKIPIAHIHGGESTFGLIDEAIRHSISKMSHLHFVSCQRYKKRLIQLGEKPNSVWNVGAIGYDNLITTNFLKTNELEKTLKISLKPPIFLFTFHPVTLENIDEEIIFKKIIKNHLKFNGSIIITGANADTWGRKIRQGTESLKLKKTTNIFYFESLGSNIYSSLMNVSDLVIGNSSSGIIEAPYIGTPSLDIGERQQGRIKAPSVLHTNYNSKQIFFSIKKGLSKDFKNIAKRKKTPYGKKGASKKIHKIITNVNLQNILKKEFHDL